MNEKDTMKNSRKTNVKSNTSDIEAKEKKEQQEQEKILAAKYLIELPLWGTPAKSVCNFMAVSSKWRGLPPFLHCIANGAERQSRELQRTGTSATAWLPRLS